MHGLICAYSRVLCISINNLGNQLRGLKFIFFNFCPQINKSLVMFSTENSEFEGNLNKFNQSFKDGKT